jgi:ABC-type branched-subunit amino acid transport system substrate-binding protein
MEKVAVVNPRGQRPPAQFVPMAPRLATLAGKTIYIVDIRWPYTQQFTEELRDILAARYPQTKFIHREKAGPYGEADPALWEEIKSQGDGVILATGH